MLDLVSPPVTTSGAQHKGQNQGGGTDSGTVSHQLIPCLQLFSDSHKDGSAFMDNFKLRTSDLSDQSRILSFGALLDARSGNWFKYREFGTSDELEK